MKLQYPFIQIPLLFDADRLAAEVMAIDESSWKPHPQAFPGNSMLPLVAVDGDPDNEAFAGRMLPTPHLQRCPYLLQVLSSFQTVVGRTRLMRLSGQSEVNLHADQGYYWVERVRIHVPIVTQPSVRFECGDAAINMKAGECWIFDTWRQHRVINDTTLSRIHLVCDTVGSARFWGMVMQGRPHDAPTAGWTAHHVQFDSRPAQIECETMNVPVVMSPWELNTHMRFLLAEAIPGPQLGQLQPLLGRLLREWRALWARYGDAPEGHAAFRETFDGFSAAARPASEGLMLRNNMRWYEAMMAMIGQVVVTDPKARATAERQRAMADNA